MTPKFLRTAVVLGLLSAIGPFAIDMYLPALPSIGESLGASTAAVQMSLLVFFLSMGFGQIVVGPISDMVGRKPPLYVGLALFAVGGIGSALAPTIEMADRLPLRAGPRRLRRHGRCRAPSCATCTPAPRRRG